MEMKECFLCHRWTYTEHHHIFGGANRKKSITVDLCPMCHREGKKAVHKDRETMLYLRQYGQRKMMQDNGWDIEDFRKELGQNYL